MIQDGTIEIQLDEIDNIYIAANVKRKKKNKQKKKKKKQEETTKQITDV